MDRNRKSDKYLMFKKFGHTWVHQHEAQAFRKTLDLNRCQYYERHVGSQVIFERKV